MRSPLLSAVLTAGLLAPSTAALAAESIWNNAATPQIQSVASTTPVELGVKWCASTPGVLRGIRFYRSTANTGPHTVRVWFPGITLGQFVLAGSQLAGALATGWVQVNFATPINIAEGRTYLASYHTASGRYSMDANYFNAGGYPASTWLRSYADGGVEGPASVLRTGALSSTAPATSGNGSNFWVDVDFTPSSTVRTRLTDSCMRPAVNAASDTGAVELGIKFSPKVAGRITGVRFYRGATTPWISYPIHLWTVGGTLLASGTIPVSQNPTSGWVQGIFSAPVNVVAGQTYVVGYHTPNGAYAYTHGGLTYGRTGLGGNIEAPPNAGVYAYGPAGSFPTGTYLGSDYFVDPLFTPN